MMTKNNNNDNQNKTEKGQITSHSSLTDIIEATFPQDHIVYAFGYGSGVFSQSLPKGQTIMDENTTHNDDIHHPQQQALQQAQPSPRSESKGGGGGGGMLDLILVVNDSYQFHHENVQRNPHHYASWLRYCGPNCMTRLQRNFFLKDARVLFQIVNDHKESSIVSSSNSNSNKNSSVKVPPMKYGIVQKEDIIQDLTEWNALYLAGRMQKPTLPILLPNVTTTPTLQHEQTEVLEAQIINLRAAVAAALLLGTSPPTTSLSSTTKSNNNTTTIMRIPWVDFYSQIANLSYSGDFRMSMGGEDPFKILKIVQGPGQLERFHSLYYESVLKPLEQVGVLSSIAILNDDFHTNDNDSNRYAKGCNGFLEWNPTDISARQYLIQQLPSVPRKHVSLEKSNDYNHANDLAKVLASIVAPVARNQSFKGIFTFGFRRSLEYASAKLSKGVLGRTRFVFENKKQ